MTDLESVFQKAIKAHQAGNFSASKVLYGRGLHICKNEFAPENRNLINNILDSARNLKDQGYLAEAEPLYRCVLMFDEEALGPDNPDLNFTISDLSEILRDLGRLDEAEKLARRSLNISKEYLGDISTDIASSLNNLALIFHLQGKTNQAKVLLEQALKIREKTLGHNHPSTIKIMLNLSQVINDQGSLIEAENIYRQGLKILKERESYQHNSDIPEALAKDIAGAFSGLAISLHSQGRFTESEALHRHVLAIYEKIYRQEHPKIAASLNSLATVLNDQGKLAEAEGLHRRALAIREKVYRSEHPDIANSLNNLASVLHGQGKLAEAEGLHRRALAIREKVYRSEHPDIANSLNNLASVLHDQGRLMEAKELYHRAIAIQEKTYGSEHPNTSYILNNLARVLYVQGNLSESEYLHRRALAIQEKFYGQAHPNMAINLNNLGLVLQAQGKKPEAEALLHRAMTIIEHSSSLIIQLFCNGNLGHFLIEGQKPQEALPYYRRAADVLDQLFTNTQGLSEETRHTFLGQYAYIYRDYLQLLLRLHEQEAKGGHDREFLAAASRNQSRIFSELLRQGKVRNFSQEPAFIALRDQRSDLLSQLLTLREQHATLPVSDPNAAARKTALDQQINTFTADLERVESQLQRDYPRYLELIQPAPVTVEQLQKDLLRPDEVLVTFVLLPEKTVLLAVSRDHFSLHAVPIGRAALTARIHRLRNGLRLDEQGSITTLSQLDPGELHALYHDLIAPLEPQLGEGKRLLVVADGPLYSLPLELLVTHYSETDRDAFSKTRRQADGTADHPLLGEYTALTYLGQRHQFHYLPSLAALAAQRRCAVSANTPTPAACPKPTSTPRQPLIAFADPLFSPEAPVIPATAPSAAPSPSSTPAAPATAPAPATPANASSGNANPATQQTLALLARSGALSGVLPPLPQTADEARALTTLTKNPQPPYLREQAQEYTVKQLSRQGAFKNLRYLLFATHGLLGGEFLPPDPAPDRKELLTLDRPSGVAPPDPRGQPSLALTLVNPDHQEDGLLTFREVFEDLQLDVDLAILSACNTAGDSAKTTTGEGFAGLTRAFLAVGVRQLWVSHWPVESTASRDLITAAVAAREAGATDPAAALTQAREQMRTSVMPAGQDLQGQPLHLARAHPYFWAPFVTIGD